MNPAKRGFTLVALIVIVAILAVLAAMLLPALASAKNKASRINCVNNLKQCGLAFRIWEGDNDDKYPMAVSTRNGGTMESTNGQDTFHNFQVMSNELSTPKILICPMDTRTVAYNFKQFKNANLSYFVALDADESHPQRFLDGDRNLTADNEPEGGILKLSPGQRVSWTTTMHVNSGNLGLADGSVQQFSNHGVETALKNSGAATNVWRISLPD
ncbi:MAG TPA: prepilin-type N-terminal cleavage/methylation domain-containing protein [Verrucomicrobiae bacterium]|jgi:competence protein ComGC